MVAVTCALTGLALILAWSVWRTFRPRSSFLDHPVVFFLLVCGALLVVRLPEIKWKAELNPDESQSLAQGMRFLSHPVPWRDVDGETCGPLTSMWLSLPMCFGAPATWQTARWVLWASTCLTWFLLYLTLRCFGSRAEAQFALLPTVFFYTLATAYDFVCCNNETLPVLLLSAGFYLLAKGWTGDQPSPVRLFLLGLAAGSIVFTKLQAAPLALFLVVVGLAQIAVCHRRAGRPWRTGWREPLALCLGALAAPALLLGVVAAYGALGDCWVSYVLATGHYVEEAPGARLHNLYTIFLGGTDARPSLVGAFAALVLLLWACAAGRAGLPGRLRWPLIAMVAAGVLTAGCVVIAGKPFLHYVILFVPPWALFCGLVFFVGKAKLDHRNESQPESSPKVSSTVAQEHAPPRASLAFPLWLLAFSVCVAGIHFCRVPSCLHMTRYCSSVHPPKSLLAEFVAGVIQPGDTLCVWGWMPTYYVETGLSPATRYALTSRPPGGPYQSYFRNRYLGDLEQSRPVIFIDAVAAGAFVGPWHWLDTHESFPELARFIDQNYTLWALIRIAGAEGDRPVRVYLLKERLAKLRLSRANPALPARAQ
jgi:hypothetical protein